MSIGKELASLRKIILKNCEWCKVEFSGTGNKKYCSKKCGNAARQARFKAGNGMNIISKAVGVMQNIDSEDEKNIISELIEYAKRLEVEKQVLTSQIESIDAVNYGMGDK